MGSGRRKKRKKDQAYNLLSKKRKREEVVGKDEVLYVDDMKGKLQRLDITGRKRKVLRASQDRRGKGLSRGKKGTERVGFFSPGGEKKVGGAFKEEESLKECRA